MEPDMGAQRAGNMIFFDTIIDTSTQLVYLFCMNGIGRVLTTCKRRSDPALEYRIFITREAEKK
jgi:hypothetical protein